jgi:hypothetical protein
MKKTYNLSALSFNIAPDALANIINKIDKISTEIILSAEKKCCGARHESQWSSDIHISSLMCKYWLKILKGLRLNIQRKQQLVSIHQELRRQSLEKLHGQRSLQGSLKKQ